MNKVTNLRKSQEKPTELKKIITEIKNTVEGISSVLEDTAELKGELENRVMEIIGADEKEKGIGRPEGGALMPHHSMSTALSTRREVPCISNRKKVITLLPAEGRKNFSLPGNSPASEKLHSSANRKSRYLKLPVSSNGLFVYNSPSQLPFLLYKRMFLSFILWTCLWFDINCMSRIAVLCCSLINPFCW